MSAEAPVADLKMQLFVDKVPQLVGPSDLAASGFVYAPTSTEDRDLITQPRAGTVIYNTTTNKLNVYNGTAWEEVTSTVVVAGGMSRAGKAPEHKALDPKAEQMPATPHSPAPKVNPEPHHK